MPSTQDDRNLLDSIDALRKDLIDRDELIDAMLEWADDPTRALSDVIIARKAMTCEEGHPIDGPIQRQVERHRYKVGHSQAGFSPISPSSPGIPLGDETPMEGSVGRESVSSWTIAAGTGREMVSGAVDFSTDRYQILWPHARGGLGQIFVAQDTQLHRRVALKEIQPEHAEDPVSRERFVVEAEITGNLEHPGIVPVYGLEWRTDGRPYYVMRFIKGQDLAAAARRFHADGTPEFSGLEFRWLLRRFIDVCNTIAYAHSRGVLHRDIKPSNIMLGPFGETLVQDWGVAKTLGQDEAPSRAPTPSPTPMTDLSTLCPSSGSGSVTITGQAVGTPAYMSPEQADGDLAAMATTSDVYSLGATLYVLLTDRPPFSGDPVEVLRDVRRGRFDAPRAIRPRVPGALDAICRKAMAVEPSARYASALALADDIERWLADEPVTAFREPRSAMARRWIKRHQPFVAGAAAAVVATMMALGLAVPVLSIAWRNQAEARRAESRQRILAFGKAEEAQVQRGRAEKTLKFLVNAFRKPDPSADGRSLKVVDLLDRAVKDLDDTMTDQPAMRAALYNAIGETFSGLGLPRESFAAFQKALAIRLRQMGADHSETLESSQNLAMAYQDAGRLDQAIPILQSTFERRRAKLGKDHVDTIESMNDLAVAYWESGRPFEAIPLYEAALSCVRARLGVDHLDTLTIMDNLAVAYTAAGHPDRALPLHDATLAGLRARLGDDHLTTLVAKNNQARTYRALGRHGEAIRLLETTLARLQPQLGEDHPTTLTVMNGLAEAYHDAGSRDRAVSVLRAVLARRRIKLGDDHPETLFSTINLAKWLFEARQPDQAIPLAREFLDRTQGAQALLPGKVRDAIPEAARLLADPHPVDGRNDVNELPQDGRGHQPSGQNQTPDAESSVPLTAGHP
ncbi:MAG: tetratricopeptide repeat protein [Isosphaeraceae bacterium]